MAAKFPGRAATPTVCSRAAWRRDCPAGVVAGTSSPRTGVGYTAGMNSRGLDIASMTPQERLSLLDALWDSLAATPEAILITEAQCAELDRRLDELDADGPVGIP